MRLIHTADWQIGKVFRFVDDATMGVLQEARLEAIATLGRLALAEDAPTVLVAGDIYDVATAEDRTLGQPLERMRGFAGVRVAPDPGQSRSAPGRRARGSACSGAACRTTSGCTSSRRRWPSPAAGRSCCRRRSPAAGRSPTRPPGWTRRRPPRERCGSGSPTARSAPSAPMRRAQPNLIDPARPARARLDYLALGDWHGTKRIGPRCWYSGTPEVDDFGVIDGGQALLVELAGAGRPGRGPRRAPSGASHWRQEALQIQSVDDVEVVVARLRALHEEPARLLLDLCLEGTLSLAGRERLGRALDDLRAAVCFLRVDDERLYLSPSAEDLEAIAHGGFVRVAAESLRALADDPDEPAREIAARALLRLYAQHRKLAAP